ncbi:MAG: imidazolonepropionase, partial [Acidimicrobiia bacterium]
MSDVFVTGIGHLTTNEDEAMVDAVVKVEDGAVVYAGPGSDAPDQGPSPRLECEGRAVLPGFLDSHTHLVFAGDRAGEFSMKMAGASYADVAKSGGGILSTVTATRNASEDELLASAATRVRRMIATGTTTVE